MIELVTLVIHNRIQIQKTLKIVIWNGNMLQHRILKLKTLVHHKVNDVMHVAETIYC